MAGQWHGGKGSRPRPYSVTQEEFGNNFDNIFGKKEKKEKWVPPPPPEIEEKPKDKNIWRKD
jgi:hypothetical protein